MRVNIYHESGYCDIPSYMETGMPFIFCFGGRGTGKTFGAMVWAIEHVKETGKKFIFMRRTQTQIDLIFSPKFSPFKVLERKMGYNIEVRKIEHVKNAYELLMDGESIGYAAALSTFSNVRGFDAYEVDTVILDEFIPERHEHSIKDEGSAFNNMYETVNRNREFDDPPEPPLKVLGLANANEIGNPIFMELNLVNPAARLVETKQLYYLNKDRGLLLVNLDESPISQKKSQTALYRLTAGTDYYAMAIENRFVSDSIAQVRSRNMSGYVPLVTIADCTIYRHKGSYKFYMTPHRSGSPEVYTTASAALEKFRKKYYYLWNAYLNEDIEFEDRLCSVIFEKIWSKKY